ncbi:hypothetical protein FQN54_003465 [Arachnomyces sp. PD_36]|nr:hypothetical protein FQN54_003465 [Arachnomyces sp. PD_36]
MTSATLYTVERYELGTNDGKSLSELTKYAWHVSSASSLSILSVALGKISVILLLNRLIGPLVVKAHFYLIWTMVLIAFVMSAANAIVIWRSCAPLVATYSDDFEGSCINKQVHLGISMTQAGTSALTDLLLAVYAVCVFWRVNIPLLRKIGLVIVMGAGVFGVIVTGIKAHELQHILTGSFAYINLWNM